MKASSKNATALTLALFTGIAMGQAQTYPIVVGNNGTADYSDLEYSNHEKVSTDPAASAYSVSAVYVNTGATVSITGSEFLNNHAEVANSSSVSTALIHSNVADLTIKDSLFRGNTSFSVYSAATSSTGVSGSVIKMFVGNRGAAPTKGNLLVENVVFDSNQALSQYQAFGNVYLTNPNWATFRNSTFTNNLGGGVESGSINALGGAITGYGIGDTVIENSTFQGNVAISSLYARGGAVFANTEYNTWKSGLVSLNIRNSNFIGNSAVQVETEKTSGNVWAAGGALYIAKTGNPTVFQVEIADSTFADNYASVAGFNGALGTSVIGGGAIYNQDANIRISASQDIVNTGNHFKVFGVREDDRGGFLFMKGGSTEFSIDEGASLVIGDGRVGYDSIASHDSTSVISKTGGGTLLVNSSMEYFKGTLNVLEGSMTANGKLGASQISIANDSTLVLTIGGDNILTNPNLELSNLGTINLVAGHGLRGDFTVAANSALDFGQVRAYGGTFSDNLFSIHHAGDIIIGEPSEPLTIDQNAVVPVFDGEVEFEIALNVESGDVVINSISNVTSSLEEVVSGDYSYIAAYSFDVNLGEGDSVRLTFAIGEPDLNISMFSIYYNSGSGWGLATDVSNISYDGGYFSFDVSHFSEYGFVVQNAVPEPSTCALLLGTLALTGLARRRRRSRC